MPCVSIALALLTACATPVLCQSGLHLVPPDGDVRSRSSDEACRVMPALRIAAPALSGLDGWTGDADNGADALGDEHPVVTDGSLCPSSCVRPPGADLPPVTLRHGPLWRYDGVLRAFPWSGLFTLPAEDQVRVRPARPLRLSAAWPPSARPRGRDRAAGRRTVVGGMCDRAYTGELAG